MNFDGLELLQKKYEFLDFKDATVLDCFHAAKEETQKLSSSDAIANLNLEHYFLYYLILEIQKGNDSIKEAVLFGLESKHQFFLQKRPDLSRNVPKEQQFVCYEKAFNETILMYSHNGTKSFESLLMDNIIHIYKNYHIKQEGIVMTKYDLKLVSIYDVFASYDKDLVTFSLTLFKGTSFEYLLIRHYGVNYDGKNAIHNLTFQEKDRLNRVLTIMEERLKAMRILRKSGYTLDKMEKLFKGKNDMEIATIISKVCQSSKKEETVFKTKSEILKYYHITETVLEEAVELVSARNARCAFKYTYGIGCNVMEKNKILEMADINMKEYKDLLLMVKRQLPSYIEKVSGEKPKIAAIKPKVVEKNDKVSGEKPKIAAIKPKVVEKNDNIETILEEKKHPKKNDRRRPNSFFEYFYREGMSEEEKKEIDEKVKLIIQMKKDNAPKTYEALIKLYGENYDTSSNVPSTSIEASTLHYLRKGIMVMLEKYSLEQLEGLSKYSGNNSPSGCQRPNSFFEYFYREEMSEEEKKKIDEKVKLVIEYSKERAPKEYQVFTKLYDDSYLKKGKCIFTDGEKARLSRFIRKIKEIISQDLISLDELEKQNKLQRKNKRPNSFFEYFYREEMTEEEKKNIDEKVKMIIQMKKNSSPKTNEVLIKLYGENYDTLSTVSLTQKEICLFYRFKETITSILETYSLEELKEMVQQNTNDMYVHFYGQDRNRPRSFFEYFYREEMTEEEKKEIDEKVKLIIQMKKNKAPKSYEVLVKAHGENYDSAMNPFLTPQEKNNLQHLKEIITNKLGNYSLEELKEMVQNGTNGIDTRGPRRPNSFFEYFYREEMSEEEKKEIEEKVKLIIQMKSKTDIRRYEIFRKIYDENGNLIGNGKLPKLEVADYNRFKTKIYSLLRNEKSYSLVNTEKIEQPETEDLEFSSSKEQIDYYLDSIILKLYDTFQNHDLILSKLNISKSTLINCYIRHLDYFNNLDEILDYIIEVEPDSIPKILSSDLFMNFSEYLTEKEQELVYLCLLRKKNKQIDDNMISKITDLDLETISHYEIMTKDDHLNQLNQYIKKVTK